MPAQHSIVAIVLSLLEILELPRDATLSSATEALEGVCFACLCGDPRYEVNFDFRGIVGTFGLMESPTAELARSLIMSFLRIKNTKKLNQRSSGRQGATQQIYQLSQTLNSQTTTTGSR